ncbi:hypothetical protein AMJ80_04475 [bacterium SM23_31]|nr:MAG: hypothetical protein AMJ80_04475 [bacterium SM23_31]
MESIKQQTYKNIITIVHSDDPRDKYVTGDIIIQGQAYGLEYGNGTYNLYNNRLLRAIPEEKGWYHFIDDDDKYSSPDVIEKLVNKSKKDHINIAKVKRWNNVIFPRHWGSQKSYQTECFFLHTDHRLKAKWWGNKGGDHNYSKQLTKILPINWIEKLLICEAQEGKGHGLKLDKGAKRVQKPDLPPDTKVAVLGLRKHMTGKRSDWIKPGQIRYMSYGIASKLEKLEKVKITFYMNQTEKPPPRNILEI